MTGPSERRYTAEEADALLPWLTESLREIRRSRRAVLSKGERVRSAATSNGGGDPGPAYWDALATLRREIERIAGLGLVLRDADTGLIDFPSMREGREIFLCWRLGEGRVGFYHGTGSGFAGRRAL